MDRPITKSKAAQIKRAALIAAVGVALISGVVTLANIVWDRAKILPP